MAIFGAMHRNGFEFVTSISSSDVHGIDMTGLRSNRIPSCPRVMMVRLPKQRKLSKV